MVMKWDVLNVQECPSCKVINLSGDVVCDGFGVTDKFFVSLFIKFKQFVKVFFVNDYSDGGAVDDISFLVCSFNGTPKFNILLLNGTITAVGGGTENDATSLLLRAAGFNNKLV